MSGTNGQRTKVLIQKVHSCNVFVSLLLVQSLTSDGGVGGVSPNGRLYSQNYPSIYSSGAVTGKGGGQNGTGDGEREKSVPEAERSRQRSGIEDLEEEGEDEEEEEDMDERRPYGNESAGEEQSVAVSQHIDFACCVSHA